MLNFIDPDDEPTVILTSLEVSPEAMVRETTSIGDVRAMLVALGVTALAVVDEEFCLLGIIRRTDIAGATATCAADVMIDFEYARVDGRSGRIDVYFNSCHVSCGPR